MVSDHIFNKYEELPERQTDKTSCEYRVWTFTCSICLETRYAGINPARTRWRKNRRQKPSVDSERCVWSILGALYLDQGNEGAWQFLSDFVFPHISSEDYNAVIDYKTMLQEYSHQAFSESVTYELVSSTGPKPTASLKQKFLLVIKYTVPVRVYRKKNQNNKQLSCIESTWPRGVETYGIFKADRCTWL